MEIMERTHDAAGVAILNEYNEILLVHQTYGKKHWSMPGGVVENGESAWAAAARECKEEINIEVQEIELSGIYFMSHRNGYIYTFKSRKFNGELVVDNKEIDEYGYFSFDKLPRPITNFTVERIHDAITSEKVVFKDQHVRDYKTLE
jgi:8-oxo-dGTP pyrophosphatase MutT (NUDIX family)